MTETLCDSGNVKLKAGLNAPTLTPTQYTDIINETEGFVCAQARYDFVTNYASLSTIGKAFLKDVTSNLAATDVLKYDMSDYSKTLEAQTMLDVAYSKAVEAINLLRDDKWKKFVIAGTE